MKVINASANRFRDFMMKVKMDDFKSNGTITPVYFFLKDNQPCVGYLPPEFLESQEGKAALSYLLKEVCKDPSVSAMGWIFEAYLTQEGCKFDTIMMNFATRESEELFVFPVDIINKTIGERFDVLNTATKGLFVNLFKDVV